ncbi:MAG TPA: oxidoreductase [Candidatus Rokubacteria bacterium]|nr:MAG: oxidoreductase [Candidatus Rokubacteria bacterium GWA2_73_35]HBH04271.1 oxidoreductase [Candidatus Rokubacteria bacterium]
MGLGITQVDAFTDRPFAGNPAAVCVPPGPREPAWMQAVAREMNLAETAFLEPRADGFGLRWFTPTVEVDLCGHATLAAAHVLWEESHLPPGVQARFHTRSGLLSADRRGAWIELNFPATPAEPAPPPPGLAQALGAPAAHVGRTRFDYLVEVDAEATLRGLRPDHAALAALPVRGVIVTSRAAAGGFDFVSRFFAPAAGIPEDPVTGSSHCALGPYWGARLGKTEMLAYQASARGGVVRVRLAGERVRLGGQAVTVLRGQLV